MEPSLSVIIITKNGAQTIEKCLRSVQWANEIIILDSGSTDNTQTICHKYTKQFFQTDWPGFGPQKNRALEKATGDWILSIDDDEWLSDNLIAEIKHQLKNPSAKVFAIPRRNQYCGHWIRFGDVGKDTVIRLFKRNTAHFSDDIVHEKVVTDHPVQLLKSRLYHNSYRSFEALMARMNTYTTLSAESRFSRGKKTSFTKALVSATWAFVRSYFVRLGFLDGRIGFIVAVSSAESSYYRHLKLMYLNENAQTVATDASIVDNT